MPLNVHIFSGTWDLPSESPFCLKLLTWLKMADIPFETCVLKGIPKSKSGKAPYVERDDGSILEDSSLIIETLAREYDVALDANRSAQERARMLLIQRTVENHLYFAVLTYRWRDHWPELRAAYFEGNIPAPLLWVVGPLARRATLKQAHGHGMGRMPWTRAISESVADIDALATTLGDREFFLDTPGLTDAIVYGALENIRGEPIEGPLADALAAHQNLLRWLDRVRERYWSA